MNDKLKIMHNDNHFGNILIKIGLPEYESKYQIDKIEYIKNKNYRLCFYDFDLSYLEKYNNPYLNEDIKLVQNKKSAKDIWTLLNSIILNLNYTHILRNIFSTEPIIDYFKLLVNNILDNSTENIKKLEKIYNESSSKFWNAYCLDNNQKNCIIPHEPYLYPLKVLERLINNKEIFEELNFIKVNSFHKKYLKYKNKYIKLKNSISKN
jgi:hypothetical protein